MVSVSLTDGCFPSLPTRKIRWCNVSIITEGENHKLPHGSMTWLDLEPLGQRSCTVRKDSLPAPPWLIFPAEPSESYCSCSCNPQVPATALDLLQTPSFCKTVSGALVCLGNITDVSKQNQQPRASFSSCHPDSQQQEAR